VERYAELAFSARSMPEFGYGCAVFLQSDVVDFQRRGFDQGEILAGLAAVLPKNVWLYVCQMPNLAHLGRRFVLQGGTQNNLAAVRAQVEFIEEHFDADGLRPDVAVHRFAGESGAIGAALEARELYERGRRTDFIGLEAVESIEYRTTHDERTRCVFCSNRCARTFIDVRSDAGAALGSAPKSGSRRAVPLEDDATRIVVATCDKGAVELVDDFRAVKQDLDELRAANPDLAAAAPRAAFRSYAPISVASTGSRIALTPSARRRERARKHRGALRIGIPRVLAMYSLGPLFSAYLESLGVSPTNVVWSEPTSESLYKQGSNRGAIDPCFPSKVALAHVHDLLHGRAAGKRVDVVFFPMIDNLPSRLAGCIDQRACSALSATPEAVKAAFTSEQDLFSTAGVRFVSRVLHPADPLLLEREMMRLWGPVLGLDADENRRAVRAGYAALERFDAELRRSGRAVLDRLESEGRLGIVLLGRPYHADPGMNHGIPGEFQVRGYPTLTVGSLPLDADVLERLFAEDLRAGRIDHPLEIRDVWKNSFSANTNEKIFAAKYVARHPNLVALELSSFKCGHDAPICTIVERIVESSGTPYFSFRDLDENRPSGSIKLRVETIAHFLESYSEHRSNGTLFPSPMRPRPGLGARSAPAHGAPT
jgi:predicted nucleotide-binding protein (sugar kinase/HSP70/actin superfamily)